MTQAQLGVTSDSNGTLLLTDGIAGDQVKIDNALSGSGWGVQSIQFADGSSLTKAQLITLIPAS